MRRPIIAGNWKMNTTYDEAMDLVEELVDGLEGRREPEAIDIVLCPPFLWLFPAAEYVEDTGLLLGAQNCNATDRGALTGILPDDDWRGRGANERTDECAPVGAAAQPHRIAGSRRARRAESSGQAQWPTDTAVVGRLT